MVLLEILLFLEGIPGVSTLVVQELDGHDEMYKSRIKI